MSNTWEPVGDGVHECQNAANLKPDGTKLPHREKLIRQQNILM
jgi:hypothetical protein